MADNVQGPTQIETSTENLTVFDWQFYRNIKKRYYPVKFKFFTNFFFINLNYLTTFGETKKIKVYTW